jgi:hypothetical protein
VLKEKVEIKNDREFVLDLKALVKSKIAHYAIPHKFQVGFIKCIILIIKSIFFFINLDHIKLAKNKIRQNNA